MFITQFLVSLLLYGWFGCSLLFSSTAALPVESSPEYNHLKKRALPAFQKLIRMAGGGFTYYVVLPTTETEISDEQLIAYAEDGYNQISSQFSGVVITESGILPGVGIVVGSKIRGETEATAIRDLGIQWFTRWWDSVQTRVNTASSGGLADCLHAEDHVLVRLGKMYAESRRLTNLGRLVRLPAGTRVVAYGRYSSTDEPAGVRNPCEGGSLTISCQNVLTNLGVSWIKRS
jgi:hypothetical protein